MWREEQKRSWIDGNFENQYVKQINKFTKCGDIMYNDKKTKNIRDLSKKNI